MSRTPIGETAMTDAERSRRRREKAKALRDAALPPDVVAVEVAGSEADPIAAPPVAQFFSGHDYPRMLYHPDGRTTIADTPEYHDRLTPDGWGTIPLAVHRQRPVTAHGVLGDGDPLAMMIKQAIREVFDEHDLSEAMRQLLDEYDLLEGCDEP